MTDRHNKRKQYEQRCNSIINLVEGKRIKLENNKPSIDFIKILENFENLENKYNNIIDNLDLDKNNYSENLEIILKSHPKLYKCIESVVDFEYDQNEIHRKTFYHSVYDSED